MLGSNLRAQCHVRLRAPRASGLAFLVAATLALCTAHLTAYAQGRYPPSREMYVADYADELTAAETHDLRSLLRTVLSATNLLAAQVLLAAARPASKVLPAEVAPAEAPAASGEDAF